MFGIDSPKENANVIQNYFIPSSLSAEDNLKSIIFLGNRRCAYYFNAPLDSNGVLTPQAKQTICNNLNSRLEYLVRNVFSVTGLNVPKVFSLRSQSFDEHAVFQNKKLSVRPSLYRSIHTGNCIGNSLFVKQGQVIKLGEEIGHWGGELLSLTASERKARVEENPTWQFYSVGLQLGTAVLESIRMHAGLPVSKYDRYFGELDCEKAAKSGACLMSYSNTVRDVYHEYGFRVQSNAMRPNQSGCTQPVLRSTSDISEDSEILWANGQHLHMPKTLAEEEFSRIGVCDSYNSWSYGFTRQEVIEYITSFNKNRPNDFLNASSIVNEAIKNCDSSIELAKHCTGKSFLTITTQDIARCRMIADVGSKRKISEYHVSIIRTCGF